MHSELCVGMTYTMYDRSKTNGDEVIAIPKLCAVVGRLHRHASFQRGYEAVVEELLPSFKFPV